MTTPADHAAAEAETETSSCLSGSAPHLAFALSLEANEEARSWSSGDGWTAAHCCMVLRWVKGQISSLQRTGWQEEEEEEDRGARGEGRENDRLVGGEEEGVMGGRGKKLQRTYTSKGRGKTKVQKPTSDDSSTFQLKMPICFSQKDENYANHICSEATHAQPFTSRSGKHWNFPADVRVIYRMDQRAELQSVVHGITGLFEITRGDEKGQRFGSRSLFKTCLAVIPAVVMEEDDLFSGDAEASSSSDMYAYLEEFGSSGQPGSGWRPLKEVLRHHTILLLSNAIEDQSIGLPGARELIDVCIRWNAVDAAQRLLHSVLNHAIAHAITTQGGEISQPQSLLWAILGDFCMRTGRHAYAYHWFAQLLEEQRMPVSWLPSQIMIPVLNNALSSFAHGDEDATLHESSGLDQAAALLRTIVRKSYEIGAMASSEILYSSPLHCSSAKRQKVSTPQPVPTATHANARRKTLEVQGRIQRETNFSPDRLTCNILSMLSAINFLNHRGPTITEIKSRQRCFEILQQMADEARRILEKAKWNGTESQYQGVLSVHIVLPLLAAGLATIIADDHPSSSTALPTSSDFDAIMSLTTHSTIVRRAGSFLSAVANDCAKGAAGTGCDAFSFLQSILGLLEYSPPLPTGDQSTKMKLLKDIKVAAAFAFCDNDCQPAHLEWAMSMEQTVDMPALESPARATAQCTDRYMWEEGISEWASRTPTPRVSEKPWSSLAAKGKTGSGSERPQLQPTDESQILSSNHDYSEPDDEKLITSTSPQEHTQQLEKPPFPSEKKEVDSQPQWIKTRVSLGFKRKYEDEGA